MPRDANETRERLLAAAEKVFAEQGVEQTSLVDIHRLAGQANKSALHYHFGSRERLLEVVLERHTSRVEPIRREMVEELRAAGRPPTLHEVLTALIAPLARQMRTESGRACVRIVSHVRHRNGYRENGTLMAGASPDLHWLYSRLEEHLAELPGRLREERIAAWNDMAIATLAGWARTLQTGAAHSGFGIEELMVNLVDMGAGALGAVSRLASAAR